MQSERHTLASTLTLLVAAAGAGLTLTAAGPAGAAPGDCQGRAPTIVATGPGQTLNGTPGSDVILAEGYDRLTVLAGAGNDFICSSNARGASLFGGEGDDRFDDVADQDLPGRTAPNVLDGGPGSDFVAGTQSTAVSYDGATAGVTIDVPNLIVTDGADMDGFIVQQHDDGLIFYGSRFADRYVGSSQADTFYSSLADRHLGAGDDVRTGGGNDEVFAARGSRVLLGAGDDTAVGIGSVVYGEPGDDRISLALGGSALGGIGDDTLRSQTEPDLYGSATPPPTRLVGGSGNDALSIPFTIGARQLGCGQGDVPCARGTLVGGPGTDALDINTEGGTVDLAAGRAWVRGGRSEIGFFERVIGSRGRDVIRGDKYRNLFRGWGGDDVFFGRGGPDLITGGDGRDRADGGAGRDRCEAEVRRSC